MFENEEKHPSYGMLSFSRRTGGKLPLFGSSIQHKEFIAMTLKHGEVLRELNGDYYIGDKVIAEVEMSYSQFAEAITAMNVGDGVPVTVRFTEKDGYIEERPFVSKRDQFESEFSDHLNEIKKEIKDMKTEVSELFSSKKAIGKSDKEYIMEKLDHIYDQVGVNTEFVYAQFNRQMDKTVMEAKGEVEAFVQNKMNSIALATLSKNAEEFTKLENPIDLDTECLE